MYCQHCGSQLPDQAQYCPKCGKAQNSAHAVASTPESPAQYEYCEIVYESKISFFMKSRLWAKATGPKGVYTAACEEKWRTGLPTDPAARRGTQAACDQMIMQLQAEGWELLPLKGPGFWSYKFQRRVS